MSAWSALTTATDHRPWPLPSRPWVMTMTWCDLLFAHWSFPPEILRPLIPPPLELDTHDGRAWLGIVPFRMEAVGPRGLGWLPARLPLRAFPELNVRTYVRHEGKPGVWFLSLDATSRAAVATARAFFHLPYFNADITTTERDDWTQYQSTRTDPRLAPGTFTGRYRPVGEILTVLPGSLEHWLTERYCLYARDRSGRARRGEIHHRPWPLQIAQAEIEVNTVARAHGFELESGDAPLLHYARQLDVVAWRLT